MDGLIGVHGSLALARVAKELHHGIDIARAEKLVTTVSEVWQIQFNQKNVKWDAVLKCLAGVNGVNVLSLVVVLGNERDHRLV